MLTDWFEANKALLGRLDYTSEIESSGSLTILNISSKLIDCQIIEKHGEDGYFEIFLVDAVSGKTIPLLEGEPRPARYVLKSLLKKLEDMREGG